MAAKGTRAATVRSWLRRHRPYPVLGVVILALILVGGFLPQLVIASVGQLPNDAEHELRTAPADTMLIDAAAYRSGEVPAANAGRAECAGEFPAFSCFLVETTSQLDRRVASATTEDREEIGVSASTELLVDDTPVFRTEDFVRLVRESAFPVPEPASEMTAVVVPRDLSVNTGQFSREGVQYFFPATTERVSYNFFDILAQQPHPLDFVDRAEREGVRTYEFQQDLVAVDLMSALARAYTQPQDIADIPPLEALFRQGEMNEEERQAINSLRVSGTAAQFYDAEERAAHAFGAEDRISLSPYYTVDRTLWVEPESGVIIDRIDEIYLYLAADQREADAMATAPVNPNRTILATTAAWDEQSRAAATERAESTLGTLKFLEVLSLLSNTLIVALVAAGLLIFLRRRGTFAGVLARRGDRATATED